jgi:hypothetical protein
MKTCCHSASSPSRVKNAPRLSRTKHQEHDRNHVLDQAGIDPAQTEQSQSKRPKRPAAAERGRIRGSGLGARCEPAQLRDFSAAWGPGRIRSLQLEAPAHRRWDPTRSTLPPARACPGPEAKELGAWPGHLSTVARARCAAKSRLEFSGIPRGSLFLDSHEPIATRNWQER